MTDGKRSKLECESAIAGIYAVGHTTLGLLGQISSIVGTLSFLATGWSGWKGDWERCAYAAALTVACAVIWRWSDRKLDAVGPDGDTYWKVKGGF